MKLKLSDLLTTANLVVIDSYEVLISTTTKTATEPDSIEFKLANETYVTILDCEVDFKVSNGSIELTTVDGMVVTCEFFITNKIRVVDILKACPDLKYEYV